MENTLQFLQSDLKVQGLLDKFKAVDDNAYNNFLAAFDEFFTYNFNMFIKHGYLDHFILASHLLGDQFGLLNYLQSVKENQEISDCLTKIFKSYYLYYYSQFDVNSFDQYYYVKNFDDAIKLLGEFNGSIKNTAIFESLSTFSNYYLAELTQSISFENQNHKSSSLEGFIASLTPEFKSLFKDIELISPLIYYLYDNKHIDKYGYWRTKNRRKSEILGLIYALGETRHIKKTDSNSKNVFCKTFHVDLTQKYINSNEETNLSLDFKSLLKPELKRLYEEVWKRKGPFISL